MNDRRQEKGFSLLEIMLTVAIIGIIYLVIVQFITPITTFFRGNQARQKANLEARGCMETIEQVMSNGRVSSLALPSTPTIPFSTAQFVSIDSSTYTIAWSSTPMNTVHLQRIPPGGGAASDTVLATHVTQLSFTVDLKDPGVVHVTLKMQVPLDISGSPSSFYTIFLPNQTIVMSAS